VAYAQTGAGAGKEEIRIVGIEGTLEIIRAGTRVAVVTQVTNQPPLNPGDRLRTRNNRRAALRWSPQSVVRLRANTEIEIRAPHQPRAQSGLHLFRGILSFFHRDKPARMRATSPGAEAIIEGTEFVLAVDTVGNTELTTLSMIDGKVRFTNEYGAPLILTNGQQAVAEPSKAPQPPPASLSKTTSCNGVSTIPLSRSRDLPLTPAEQGTLVESIAAYRTGNLLAALAKFPGQPGSDAERIYYAALLLSVGQVKQTEDALANLPHRGAIRTSSAAGKCTASTHCCGEVSIESSGGFPSTPN
jgi:hypothetical protein